MVESFEISEVIPATPRQIYEAWLSSKGHAEMTGGPADIDPSVGGKFSMFGGVIYGATLEMEPHSRIVQSWRADGFPEGSPDSRVEVLLEEAPGGAKLTIQHSNIPDGQAEGYKQGWEEHYFQHMQEHFGKS